MSKSFGFWLRQIRLRHPIFWIADRLREQHLLIVCHWSRRARRNVLHVVIVLTAVIMKTNVTLKLDADLLREARVLAAEEGRSIKSRDELHER